MVHICGIAGASLHPEEQVNMLHFTRLLYGEIVSRGRDATGAAWHHPVETGRIWFAKDCVSASLWTPDVPTNARSVILHTRATTLGSELDPANNHPVRVGNVWGVHNGVISNHAQIFKRLGVDREAQVDTEAIFAAIVHGQTLDEKGKPLLASSLTGCLEELDGTAAIAWLTNFDQTETLRVARLSYSPLVWAQTKRGSFAFASTEAAIVKACRETGLDIDFIEEAKEGTFMEVRQGRVETVTTFTPPLRYVGGYSYGRSWTPAKTGAAKVKVVSLLDDEPEHDTELMRLDIALTLRHGVEPLSIGAEEHVYAERKRDVARWMRAVPGEQQLLAGRALHAYSRVGARVWTVFDGKEVEAEIFIMPQSFPSGSYILAIHVGEGFDRERILVARGHKEFYKIKGG